LGFGDATLVSALTHVLGASKAQLPGVEQFVSISVALRAVVYGFWSLLYLVINHSLDVQENQLHIAQKEAAMRSSELQVLRGQVNPHFLFNALNSILAESGNPGAVQRITLSLAEYLRFSLRQQDDTDQLGTELNALESYLRVEKARFEENLEYTIEADEAARRSRAPVALIQPLLENAIKYGQLSHTRPLQIAIHCRVQQGALTVAVTNSGAWVEPGSKNSTGVGLPNLRRRLELLYGESAALTITPRSGQVEARVVLPVSEKES
jgi:LytS/YehU family sensor histidine kinase